MRGARRSPLFTAVVVAGASLTQAIGGCGGEVDPAESDADAAAASTAGDGGTTDGGSTDARRDAPPFTPPEASAPADAGTCPDGSDMPVPPCVLIK